MSEKVPTGADVSAPQPRENAGNDIERFTAELQQLFEANPTDETLRTFAQQRLATLLPQASAGGISIFSKLDMHVGMFRPEAEISRSLMVESFQVDDPELYELYVQILHTLWSGDKSHPARDHVPNALQQTVSQYFGNYYGTSSTEACNRDFYLSRGMSERGTVALSELKGKQLAVCPEKTAAAQNLLSFTGVESTFVASDCTFEGTTSAHAYNILKTPMGYFIYDATNPNLYRDAEGDVVMTGPALYRLTEEQYQTLLNGGSVTVDHKDFTITPEGTQPQVTQRTYAGPASRASSAGN